MLCRSPHPDATALPIRPAGRAALRRRGPHALAMMTSELPLALVAEELCDHTDEYAQALLGRAIALEGSGRGEEAAALRRQRHAVLRALYGDEHPFVRSVAAAMGSAN